MNQFDSMLQWKLKLGSHRFPGPDGGTCVNEAAIIAAGFEYRSVTEVEDCPPCFSRVIASYALRLNDTMPAKYRQLLLPFVTRLAGTADTPATETARVMLILYRTAREIFAPAMRDAGWDAYRDVLDAETHGEAMDALKLAATKVLGGKDEWSLQCRLRDVSEASVTDIFPFWPERRERIAYAILSFASLPDSALRVFNETDDQLEVRLRQIAHVAANWVRPVGGFIHRPKPMFQIALRILDSAIKIGNSGNHVAVGLAAERMRAQRDTAARATRESATYSVKGLAFVG